MRILPVFAAGTRCDGRGVLADLDDARGLVGVEWLDVLDLKQLCRRGGRW